MTFHVGQKVVCVKEAWPGHDALGFACPKKGSTYQIRAMVGACKCEGGRTGFYLEEISNPPTQFCCLNCEPGFEQSCFRPLIERKASTSTGFEILDDIRKRETVDDVAPVKRRQRV